MTSSWLLAALAFAQTDATSPTRAQVSLGFSHWYGETFGSPDGYTTPVVAVGVRPGVRFLEVRGRYTLSVRPLDLPAGDAARVGFGSLEVVALRELRRGDETLVASAGPLALVDHAGRAPVRGGYGLALGLEYLFALGPTSALGVFVSTRQVFYTLPGDASLRSPRRDAQIDLGVIGAAF